jgi:hypothetical protein
MPRDRATRTEINALYEDDLDGLLDGLGVLREYTDGSLRCAYCQRALTEAGVGAVRMRHRLVFACSRLDCTREIA